MLDTSNIEKTKKDLKFSDVDKEGTSETMILSCDLMNKSQLGE